MSKSRESFAPKRISYNEASDVWSAALIVNDMGTGFRLLNYPENSKQLVVNMLHVFGVPSPNTWPGVEQLPLYKTCCSPEARKSSYGKLHVTVEPKAAILLDYAKSSAANRNSHLNPRQIALAPLVSACMTLNPADRWTASAARDALLTASAQLES